MNVRTMIENASVVEESYMTNRATTTSDECITLAFDFIRTMDQIVTVIDDTIENQVNHRPTV